MRRPGPDLATLSTSIARLAAAAPLVHCASPENWDLEIARLSSARRAGERTSPLFVYRKPRIDASAIEQLERLADQLEPLGPPAEALASRAKEVALELKIAAAVGTPRLAALAKLRFGSQPADDERALAWASLAASDDDGPRVASCDESSPSSLISAMRRAVGELRLPVRVIVREGMASLAATGDGVLFVARGRPVGERDVRRTVLHEIEGHVLPWASRRAAPLPVARPAGGADAEEGRALVLEQRAGFLDRARRKELGLRHEAARLAHEGAPFVDITERLEQLGAHPMAAIRLAARACRGGGLGRERVYLPWLWKLRAGEGMPGE